MENLDIVSNLSKEFEHCLQETRSILNARYDQINTESQRQILRKLLVKENMSTDYMFVINNILSHLRQAASILEATELIAEFKALDIKIKSLKTANLLIKLILNTDVSIKTDDNPLCHLKDEYNGLLERRALMVQQIQRKYQLSNGWLVQQGIISPHTNNDSRVQDIKIHQKSNESVLDYFNRILSEATSYNQALKIYIDASTIKDYLVWDRLKVLLESLQRKHFVPRDFTPFNLYNDIRKSDYKLN